MRDLFSTVNKALAGKELLNIPRKSSHAREKPAPRCHLAVLNYGLDLFSPAPVNAFAGSFLNQYRPVYIQSLRKEMFQTF